MVKKIIIGLVLLIVAFMAYRVLTTQNLSPAQEASFSQDGLDIKVNYGQPSKRGRLIFGEESEDALVPYGVYWRLGANDATEITFGSSVNFAGNLVEAGGYRMYAVPGASTWELTLNSELGKFGYFDPDPELDVLKVIVPASASNTEVEKLTFDFDSDSTGLQMNIKWDKTIVTVPISKQ